MPALIGSIAARLVADAGPLASGLNLAGTRIDRFERESAAKFRRFDRTVTSSFGRMRAAAASGLSSLSASAIAPLAGLLSLTAVLHGTTAALDKFGNINDKIVASGLGGDLFQALAIGAKMAGVELDAAGGALAAFNKNLGDAQAGRGRLLTALRAISPELAKQVESAKDTETAFRFISTALRNARTDAERAAIAAAAFGDAGTKLANAWAIGGDKLDATVAKARELGVVIDSSLLAQADELGDTWALMAETIDLKVKSALISLGPVLVNLISLAADLANVLGDQLAGKKPLNIPSWGQGGVGTQMHQHLADVLRGMAYPETAVSGLPRRYSEAQYQFGDLGDFFNDATEQAVAKMRASLEAPGQVAVAPSDFDFRAFFDSRTPATIKKVTEAASESTAALSGTAQAVSDLQRNFETAEGVTKSFASTLIDDLLDGEDAVTSLSSAFKQLGRQLIQMAADQAISALFSNLLGAALGGSIAGGAAIPSTGFIPGLTGPKLFAAGGFVRGPGTGTSDSIPAMLSAGEYVLPASVVRRIGTPTLDKIRGYANGGYVGGPSMPPLSSNDNPTIAITVNSPVDARGSNLSEGRIAAMLDARDKALKRELPRALADARRRGAA